MADASGPFGLSCPPERATAPSDKQPPEPDGEVGARRRSGIGDTTVCGGPADASGMGREAEMRKEEKRAGGAREPLRRQELAGGTGQCQIGVARPLAEPLGGRRIDQGGAPSRYRRGRSRRTGAGGMQRRAQQHAAGSEKQDMDAAQHRRSVIVGF